MEQAKGEYVRRISLKHSSKEGFRMKGDSGGGSLEQDVLRLSTGKQSKQ